MHESFGARLRQQRERQHVALSAIADQTKIKLSLLEALEQDDVSHWPVGIFRRAFIRGYAHAIGLEPDLVVREFLERHPDPVEDVAPIAALASANGAAAGAAPPTRLGHLVGAALHSLPWLRHGDVQTHGPTIEDPFAADGGRVMAPASFDLDLPAAADLCTALGRIDSPGDAAPLLQEAARILEAVGLVVWIWDAQAAELRPELAHGYPERVLARLPTVKRDADNATAAAFRAVHTVCVNGSDRAGGAVVVPLLAPAGCVGVLAIELQHGRELTGSVRALVTIFAAQLARLITSPRPVEAANRRLA